MLHMQEHNLSDPAHHLLVQSSDNSQESLSVFFCSLKLANLVSQLGHAQHSEVGYKLNLKVVDN